MFVAIYAKHVVKTFPFHGRIQRRPGIWSKELKTHTYTQLENEWNVTAICWNRCIVEENMLQLFLLSNGIFSLKALFLFFIGFYLEGNIYNMYVLQKELNDMDWNWMVKWQQRNSITIFVTLEWLNMGEKRGQKKRQK